MDKVIKVIMVRDGMCKEDARDMVEECLAMVMEAVEEGDFIGAEDIWMSELGLEPDYLMECLY